MPKTYRLDKFELPDILAMAPKLRAKVMRAAAKIARNAARALVPTGGTGALSKALTYSVNRSGTQAKVRVKKSQGAGRKPETYAHIVHDGASSHQIHATTKESARSGWRLYHGSQYTVVKHPGAHGTPFLTDAGEQSRSEIEAEMHRKAEEVLSEIAKGQ
jgi:hypothetical protein